MWLMHCHGLAGTDGIVEVMWVPCIADQWMLSSHKTIIPKDATHSPIVATGDSDSMSPAGMNIRQIARRVKECHYPLSSLSTKAPAPHPRHASKAGRHVRMTTASCDNVSFSLVTCTLADATFDSWAHHSCEVAWKYMTPELLGAFHLQTLFRLPGQGLQDLCKNPAAPVTWTVSCERPSWSPVERSMHRICSPVACS